MTKAPPKPLPLGQLGRQVEYVLRPLNAGRTIWHCIKVEEGEWGGGKPTVYELVQGGSRGTWTCTCPSRKHPCKHIEFLERVSAGRQDIWQKPWDWVWYGAGLGELEGQWRETPL